MAVRNCYKWGIAIAAVAVFSGLYEASLPRRGPVTKVTMVTMPQEKPRGSGGEGAP
jgi:hypothetical protein